MKIGRIFISTCKNNIPQFTALIISIFAIVSLQLMPPQILRSIVDDYLDLGIYNGIVKMGLLYLCAIMLSYFAEFVKTTFTTYIGQKTMLGIRYQMSDKLMKLPMSYYNKNAVGDIMSRFTQDVEAVNTLFSQGIINMAVDLFKIVGVLISVYIINRTLFVYSLLILPIVAVLSELFRRRVYFSQKIIRTMIGKMNSFFQEAFGGLKLFKIYGIEKKLSEALTPLVDEQIVTMRSIFRVNNSFACVMQFLRSVVICIFVIMTTRQINIISGISAGALAATIDLLSRLFAPIEALSLEFQTIQQAFAGLNRINEFIDEEEEERQEAGTRHSEAAVGGGIISFNNVTFGYDNGKNILNGVTFSIKEGMKVALAGRTGAGKTTTLNLLAGLYKPDSGEILINGCDPFTMPASDRRRIIGIVPQTVNMFTGRIRDVIALGDTGITIEQIESALKMVGLYDTVAGLPDKLDTVIGEGEINFSFGEMQLMALARAIVTNPPILFLDELTSGLDAVTEAKILRAIKHVSANRTIVTISHRLSGIIDADYVYIFSFGRIVEEGSPAELEKSGGWYAKYNTLESMDWQG